LGSHETLKRKLIMSIEKVLYTAPAQATGGRDGRAVSSDGILDVKLVKPRELGGSGTSPEQLFAASYAACIIGAMKWVASRDKINLPAELSIAASVGIGAIPNGFGIEATLKSSAPGMPHADTASLVKKGAPCLSVFECNARQYRRTADCRLRRYSGNAATRVTQHRLEGR
jgi:Ohr subfamily peroxiredoxin